MPSVFFLSCDSHWQAKSILMTSVWRKITVLGWATVRVNSLTSSSPGSLPRGCKVFVHGYVWEEAIRRVWKQHNVMVSFHLQELEWQLTACTLESSGLNWDATLCFRSHCGRESCTDPSCIWSRPPKTALRPPSTVPWRKACRIKVASTTGMSLSPAGGSQMKDERLLVVFLINLCLGLTRLSMN